MLYLQLCFCIRVFAFVCLYLSVCICMFVFALEQRSIGNIWHSCHASGPSFCHVEPSSLQGQAIKCGCDRDYDTIVPMLAMIAPVLPMIRIRGGNDSYDVVNDSSDFVDDKD